MNKTRESLHKRATCLIFAGFLCITLASCAHPDASCAHLLTFKGGTCSGTAVGSRTILTAAHCIDGDTLTSVDGHKTRALWIAEDGHDHALIGQTVKFPAWIVKLDTPILAEAVHFVGNPADERELYEHGYVSGLSNDNGHVAMLYELPIFFGDSGAGIMNSRGALVGVVSGIHAMSRDGITVTFGVSYPLAFAADQWRLIQ